MKLALIDGYFEVFVKRLVSHMKVTRGMSRKEFKAKLEKLPTNRGKFTAQRNTLVRYSDNFYDAYQKFERQIMGSKTLPKSNVHISHIGSIQYARSYKQWSAADVSTLKSLQASGRSAGEIAKALGRSASGVARKASRLRGAK